MSSGADCVPFLCPWLLLNVPRIAEYLRSVSNRLQMAVLLFQQVKMVVSLIVNISKLAGRKKNQTGTKNVTA